MATIQILFLFLLAKYCESEKLGIRQHVEKINEEYGYLRSNIAEMAWNSTLNLSINNKNLGDIGKFEEYACSYLSMLFDHKCFKDLMRQTYLFCRGRKMESNDSRRATQIYTEIVNEYTNGEVCIPSDVNIPSFTIPDFEKVEAAILKYLEDVNCCTWNLENEDSVLFAAKLAVNDSLKTKESKVCLRVLDFIYIAQLSSNEAVLKWVWLTWREKISRSKDSFIEYNDILNVAAKRSGYRDQGTVWREELEMPNIRIMVQKLYAEIRHLYLHLHGVLRFHLREIYGDVVPENGPIPAHLLGTLSGESWQTWVDRLLPGNIKIEDNISNKNWSTLHAVKLVEDMYYSLGLYPMSENFWKKSIFERGNYTNLYCMSSAVDMIKQDNDFRIIYCAQHDFQLLHHELGHIEYFTAYSHQPTIYRSANSAFHEAIGEAVLLGALTPQHLNRLGLIDDSQLFGKSGKQEETSTVTESSTLGTDYTQTNEDVYEKTNHYNDEATSTTIHEEDSDTLSSEDTAYDKENSEETINDFSSKTYTKLFEGEKLPIDMILLIQRAFRALPSMTLFLALDEFRWLYLEGSLTKVNRDFWRIIRLLQGIDPPVERGEEYMDAMANYYVSHDVYTIRYFLSEFIQHQLFEEMCKASVYGHTNLPYTAELPETVQLTRCDIYGSKAAGKILLQLMTPGNSVHWRELWKKTTGQDDITAGALNRYYKPLLDLLKRHVSKYNIPIGW